jgi:hypothetical protein
MNEPCFIYYYKHENTAIARVWRDDIAGQLLFTCPKAWCPKNQEQFDAAAKFYEVNLPHRMRYIDDSEDVPF